MEEEKKERVAGIDVSKAGLEVWMEPGPAERYENSKAGIRALVKRMGREENAVAVYEPTGGYEREMERGLREGGIRAKRVHPNRVRGFARAYGKGAKTDEIDAEVLAHYGKVLAGREADQGEIGEEREELREIMRRRQQLVKERVAEKNRLDKGIRKKVRSSTERHIRWLDREIERLEGEYESALESSREMKEQAALYESVPGVGKLTAATLVAELPELGQGDGKGLTSMVGLAPWTRDSGRQRGYRAIEGGRATVRRVLYLAALSRVRKRESRMGRYYQRLRSRGKPAKVALVAVMRKMLLQLHAVAQRGTPWQENYAPAL